ncbi:MAG TPA: ACT domain-containing protein [Candidatus Acidoferrum sp.]|nr:ACT domain-containing protein [Candidatus Acidoferrum sp.]
MNTLTLRLQVKNDEGALVRILGTTRRRRFDLVSLKADCSPDGSFLEVRMTVQADRPESTLVRHLEKLMDVSQVEVVKPGEGEEGVRAAASTT